MNHLKYGGWNCPNLQLPPAPFLTYQYHTPLLLLLHRFIYAADAGGMLFPVSAGKYIINEIKCNVYSEIIMDRIYKMDRIRIARPILFILFILSKNTCTQMMLNLAAGIAPISNTRLHLLSHPNITPRFSCSCTDLDMQQTLAGCYFPCPLGNIL